MSRNYVDDQGDWFPFTLAGGARQQSCGCGLTQDIEVRRKGRRYQMRILRRERATDAARRARKKTVGDRRAVRRGVRSFLLRYA